MNKRIAAMVAACVMLVAGCSAPPAPSSGVVDSPSTATSQPESTPQPTPEQPQEVDRELTYSVSTNDYDGEPLRFDADGSLLPPDELGDMVTLRDLVTREPRYRMHTLVEDTGEDNEYGGPLVRRTTALWDINGNLLYDYGDYTYSAGFGDLLIRQGHRDGFWVDISMIPNGYYTELWNVKTGERVQNNVAELSQIGDSGSLFLATDVYGYLLGTVDSNGSVVKGFDSTVSGYFYSWVSGDMIVASNRPYDYEYTLGQQTAIVRTPSTGPQKEILLTPELAPVAAYNFLSHISGPEGKHYLWYRDGINMGLMDMRGNKLFALPSSRYYYPSYCDNELIITELDTHQSVLMDMQGNALTTEFDQLYPIGVDRWKPEAKPERFVAQLGTTVSLLDRQGQVLASRDIPELVDVRSVGNDYISFSVQPSSYCGLLDMELATVLEPDRYNYIMGMTKEDTDGKYTYSPMICANYHPNRRKNGEIDYSVIRYDILDSKLAPIITNLTAYGTVGQGRIAVVRGFSAGVIDWQGNWIGKTSIFQTAGDELGREMY